MLKDSLFSPTGELQVNSFPFADVGSCVYHFRIKTHSISACLVVRVPEQQNYQHKSPGNYQDEQSLGQPRGPASFPHITGNTKRRLQENVKKRRVFHFLCTFFSTSSFSHILYREKSWSIVSPCRFPLSRVPKFIGKDPRASCTLDVG